LYQLAQNWSLSSIFLAVSSCGDLDSYRTVAGQYLAKPLLTHELAVLIRSVDELARGH